MMKRTFSSLRFVKSVASTQISGTRSSYNQVTDFSILSSQIRNPLSAFFSQKKLFFSSKSGSVLQEIVSNNWLETEKLSHTLSHETVVYILNKLDKDPQKVSDFFSWVTEENGFRPSSTIYSIMLRIYASKNAMQQLWFTIKEMKEKGYYLDEETYVTILVNLRKAKMVNDATALKHFYERMIQENAMGEVVEKVVDTIQDLNWDSMLERRLGEMNIKVTENFILRVLKELRVKGLRLKALSFFRWVRDGMGYEHNSVTYNGILRILCKEECALEFWGVVREMQDAGYHVDIDTYIKIMREFQKSKMHEDAVKLYEHMMDSPFKPLAKECSLLLRVIAACRDPDLDLVFRVKRKYEEAGFCLGKSDYDGIHRSLTSVGNFDEAEKLVETMKSAGYQPDNITYSQLIFGFGKAKRLEEAYNVLDRMEAEGLRPDIMTWTILIKGCCLANDVEKALLYFARMVEKGLDADADLLEVLVQGFLNQNKVIGAYQLLTEMTNRCHLKPWQNTLKNLIERLLGDRRLEEALDVLRVMKSLKYPPLKEPFMEYIAKSGSVDDALALLKTISSKQFPSVSAYQQILQSFFDEGRHSEAKDLLFKLPHHVRKHPAISSLFGSPVSSEL